MNALRPAVVALLLLAAWDAGAVEAGPPVVRVTLDAKGPVMVGQQVTVQVQVLVPNFFMSGLEFQTITIPGAIVRAPGDDSEHLTETIGGESYAGIQQSFVITPQQAGDFTLPPAKITFTYAAEPGKATAGAVALPPQKFTARLPAGAPAPGAAGAPVEPVAKVTLTQTLDRGLDGLKAGDTLTRTVRAFAERTPAMMIPPPTFEVPPGVRMYRKDPVVRDEMADRGGLVGGHRTDRVTYLFDKPGDYTLPAVEVGWMNPATGKPETARAPALTIHVAPNPAFVPALAPEPPPTEAAAPTTRRVDWKRWAAWTAIIIVGMSLITWLLRRYRPRYTAWRRARQHAHEESETAYFARAERACRSSDAPAAYRALTAWSQRAGFRSIAGWCAERRDAGLSDQLGGLERTLFGAGATSGAWDGTALAAALHRARHAWLADHAHKTRVTSGLPALNP